MVVSVGRSSTAAPTKRLSCIACDILVVFCSTRFLPHWQHWSTVAQLGNTTYRQPSVMDCMQYFSDTLYPQVLQHLFTSGQSDYSLRLTQTFKILKC